jgi:hypothetical protein
MLNPHVTMIGIRMIIPLSAASAVRRSLILCPLNLTSLYAKLHKLTGSAVDNYHAS